MGTWNHGQQCDGLVGASLSPEEIDEQSFGSGVLIGDEADGAMARQRRGDLVGGALFGDDSLAHALADAQQPAVDIGVVQGSGDAGGVEAQSRQHVAENLPVAIVPGEHDQPLVFGQEQFEHGSEVFQLDVFVEGGDVHQSSGEEHVHAEHEHLAHALAGDAGQLLFGLFRKRSAEVSHGAVAVFFIDQEHEVSQQPRGSQDQLDRPAVQAHGHDAQGQVLQAVQQVVAGFSHGRADCNGAGGRVPKSGRSGIFCLLLW